MTSKVVKFIFIGATAGTYRFSECDAKGNPVEKEDQVVGGLYVKKTAVKSAPKFVTATLEFTGKASVEAAEEKPAAKSATKKTAAKAAPAKAAKVPAKKATTAKAAPAKKAVALKKKVAR